MDFLKNGVNANVIAFKQKASYLLAKIENLIGWERRLTKVQSKS